MKRYAVSLWSHYTGYLKLEFVEADSEAHALVVFMRKSVENQCDPEWVDGLEAMLDKENAYDLVTEAIFNSDNDIEVKEIL